MWTPLPPYAPPWGHQEETEGRGEGELVVRPFMFKQKCWSLKGKFRERSKELLQPCPAPRPPSSRLALRTQSKTPSGMLSDTNGTSHGVFFFTKDHFMYYICVCSCVCVCPARLLKKSTSGFRLVVKRLHLSCLRVYVTLFNRRTFFPAAEVIMCGSGVKASGRFFRNALETWLPKFGSSEKSLSESDISVKPSRPRPPPPQR